MAQAHRPAKYDFPFLPTEITDREGRLILVKPQDGGDFFGLVSMYDQFEPKALAQGLPPLDRQQTARWIRQLERECFNLVAIHQARIVGHAILTDLGTDRSSELAIFVDQAYRRRGLGTQLAWWAMKCASAAHCKLLWALVQRYNRPALEICRKAGFSIAEDILEPDVEMRLRLEGCRFEDFPKLT